MTEEEKQLLESWKSGVTENRGRTYTVSVPATPASMAIVSLEERISAGVVIQATGRSLTVVRAFDSALSCFNVRARKLQVKRG